MGTTLTYRTGEVGQRAKGRALKRSLRSWITFVRDVAVDERIPTRNKAILAGMLVWLASPVDLIPDFIPVLGYLDDLIVVVLLLDYVLNEIPFDVLADHYPGDRQSLLRMRRRTRWLRHVVPGWIRRRLWKQVTEKAQDGGA